MGWNLKVINCLPANLDSLLDAAQTATIKANATKSTQIAAAVAMIKSLLFDPKIGTYPGTNISIGIMDTEA